MVMPDKGKDLQAYQEATELMPAELSRALEKYAPLRHEIHNVKLGQYCQAVGS